MGFLAPWFLAGALGVVLPLWLHMLRRHRTNPQPFSSLMFFERRMESSVQPKRLRYLVLLSLRIALLLLLALAFANPYINYSQPSGSRQILHVIAIDRSFSMRYGDRMAAARRLALGVIDSLPSRAQAQVIGVDSAAAPLSPPTIDHDALRSGINSIQPTDLRASQAEFVRALRLLQQNSNKLLAVHLVSDFQQTAMPTAFADLQLPPNTTLQLHSVAADAPPNWAVTSVNAPAQIYDPSRIRVAATVAGWQTPEAARKVTLLLDGKLLATKDAAIPANGRASVEFTGFNVPYGTHRAQIRLEGSDGLPDDNVLPFSMERSDTRPVLFLSNGHGRDSFYYRTALEAAQNTGLSVQVVNAPQWEGEDFARYPFVVVSDVGVLPPGLDQRLSTFVRRGGSLLLLAGPAMARHGRTPVGGLPVELSTVTQAAAHVDNTYRPLNDVGSFDNVQFFVTARLGNASNARVTAKLSDGSPLLVEQTIGEGRVLTFASTFDNATSDLPLHKSFIPFVAATARYLARLEDVSADVVTGAPVQVRRSNENGAAVDVIGPDGAHELSLREAAQAQYFVPRRSGFYELHRADGGRFLLAAHADPLESDLSRTPDETLTIWRNTGSVTNSTPGRAAETTSYQQTYWQWILLFALGCALAESIFASRYLSPERKAHDSSRSTERVFAKT